MRNEIASLFSLAVLVPAVGCDIGAVPGQAANAPRVAPHSQLSNGRYQVDPERNRSWFLTDEGVIVHDVSRRERVTVSLPHWVWVGASYACPPVLALGPEGEAVITSNVLPTVWRVDPDSFAVSVHPLELDADEDKDVGFSGLVYSRQHGAFLAASQIQGSLWKIDPGLTSAQKIRLAAPRPDACD
jgi:hypothetical protein